VTLDLSGALAKADLAVVATPAGTTLAALDAACDTCPEGAITIDVASTKSAICAHAAARWPRPRRFIGCHPMAGSEKSGPEHATATLYGGTVCFVEDSADLDGEALRRVRLLWERVGARPVSVDPALHDTLLARTSHVPHILSTILATAAAEKGATRDFVGNGFRDMTRIAAGSPEMWRDITLTNRDAIAAALAEVKGQIDTFLAALSAGDAEALAALFEGGKDAREGVIGE